MSPTTIIDIVQVFSFGHAVCSFQTGSSSLIYTPVKTTKIVPTTTK